MGKNMNMITGKKSFIIVVILVNNLFCKSFRRHVDTIIEKKEGRPYWLNSLFCVYLILLVIFIIKINLVLY